MEESQTILSNADDCNYEKEITQLDPSGRLTNLHETSKIFNLILWFVSPFHHPRMIARKTAKNLERILWITII